MISVEIKNAAAQSAFWLTPGCHFPTAPGCSIAPGVFHGQKWQNVGK